MPPPLMIWPHAVFHSRNWRNSRLGLCRRALQFIDEFQCLAAHVVRQRRMKDALDPSGIDAFLQRRLKIDEFLRGKDNFSTRQGSIMISLVQPFKDGARIERL